MNKSKVLQSLVILSAAFALSSCAMTEINITVNGADNKIDATGAVTKSTKDLLDLAGSAYGDADTNSTKQQAVK